MYPHAFVDLALVVAAGALLGPLFLVAPAATGLGALAAWSLAASGLPRRQAAACLAAGVVALGLSAHRGARALESAGAESQSIESALDGPRRCELAGAVAVSPTKRGDVIRAIVDVETARCFDGPSPAGPFRVGLTFDDAGYPRAPVLTRGDRIDVVADIARPERFWNPELGDPWPRLARSRVFRTGSALGVAVVARGMGPGAFVDRARAAVRDRIVATFSVPAAPMARALVLGEADLAPDDDQAFKTSGLSHLLAVSGMHLVLVVVTFERALRSLLRSSERLAASFDAGRCAAWAAIPAAWLYADFAGASGSALRAAWMLSVLLAARAFGRRTTAARAIALSTLAAALFDPLAAFDVSLVLSLAATAGLVAFSTPLARFFGDEAGASSKLSRAIAQSMGATIAASVPCAPLLATLGPTLPLGGLFANLVAVPLGEVAALPLCLLHSVSAWAPAIEQGAATSASAVLLALRGVARGVASVPWLSLPVPNPTPFQLAACLLASLSFVARTAAAPRIRTIVLLGCAAVAIVSEAAARMPLGAAARAGRLTASFIDVGQGDAILLDLPNGEAMLIDGGGLVGSPLDVGARVIAPMLRARRKNELAAVVLSHPHPDHYAGLPTGTRDVRVHEFWDTGQGVAENKRSHGALLESMRKRGARVVGPRELCGGRAVGGARVEVLAPCPAFDADLGANDNSMVLRVVYGERAFLFVGDAERAEEAWLVARFGKALRSDVLKVGHHGAATSSTPEFLEAVSPKVAVVSAGARNRFGHPRPETVRAIEESGAHLFRTDRDGQIVVETDGHDLSVKTARTSRRGVFTP